MVHTTGGGSEKQPTEENTRESEIWGGGLFQKTISKNAWSLDGDAARIRFCVVCNRSACIN